MMENISVFKITLIFILSAFLTGCESTYTNQIDQQEQEHDKRMRRAILAMSEDLKNRPTLKGFWNNFAQLGSSLGPALKAYHDEENNYREYDCKRFYQNFQGCCSYHEGVAGCYDYYVICNDDTISRDCRCTTSICKVY